MQYSDIIPKKVHELLQELQNTFDNNMRALIKERIVIEYIKAGNNG